MSDLYLMIENRGETTVEAFTLMGASVTRDSDDANAIGQFGTGSKYAVTTLMRFNITPIIYAGRIKIEFLTTQQRLSNGTTTKVFDRMLVKYSGKDSHGKTCSGKEPLSYVLQHGELDWTSPDMALREFISNALDQSFTAAHFKATQPIVLELLKENPQAEKLIHDRDPDMMALLNAKWVAVRKETTEAAIAAVCIKLVQASHVRARAGYTRVFIPAVESVLRFYSRLSCWFLHFDKSCDLYTTLLPKNNRSVHSEGAAVAYRRGVLLREVRGKQPVSLFDYNFQTIAVDEARNVDDYRIAVAAASALLAADVPDLVTYFKSLSYFLLYWEHRIPYYLFNEAYARQSTAEQRKYDERWVAAWNTAYASNVIPCSPTDSSLVEHKGYVPLVVSAEILEILEPRGIRTAKSIISCDDRDHVDSQPPPSWLQEKVDVVWDFLVRTSGTVTKDKPALKTFSAGSDGGVSRLGFYRDACIYLNRQYIRDGNLTPDAVGTIVEELTHHITGANDCSVDLQDFTFRMIAAIIIRDGLI